MKYIILVLMAVCLLLPGCSGETTKPFPPPATTETSILTVTSTITPSPVLVTTTETSTETQNPIITQTQTTIKPSITKTTTTQNIPTIITPGSTKNNPIKMGSSFIIDGGIQITVITSVKGDIAWSIIKDANEFNDLPEANMQYMLVIVDVINISSPKEPWNTFNLLTDLLGSSNVAFGSTDKSAVLPDSGMYSELYGELYHGGEVNGALHFYIPKDETDLKLVIENGFLGNRYYFEVK